MSLPGPSCGLLNPYSLSPRRDDGGALRHARGDLSRDEKRRVRCRPSIGELVPRLIGVFITCYVLFNMLTLVYVERVLQVARERPWILRRDAARRAGLVMNIPQEIHRGRIFNRLLLLLRGMALLHGDVWAELLSLHGFSKPEARQQPDDLQRGFEPEDALHHADHCGNWGAGGAGLYGVHLLDLPREDPGDGA